MQIALRKQVAARARDRCEYCGLPQAALPWARFHIEHIRPRQHGGTDDLANLALACRNCNLYKGPNLTAIDPSTQQLVQLFNPRVDTWIDHFSMINNQIVGKTELGRATVTLLNMNHPDRTQLRTELSGLGEI
jgi:hypothetical protein